jgi:hypothetical protein
MRATASRRLAQHRMFATDSQNIENCPTIHRISAHPLKPIAHAANPGVRSKERLIGTTGAAPIV